jgi:hypothetical protein
MANTGKELENLVSIIEKACSPLGFDIKKRKRIFDESGNQIAELDIEVSGKFGTTEINWLIECRDRPSDGAAPIYWIEQLVGRRERLKLDKVTAVSTTGFSPGAIDFAAKVGIELRSVREIQKEDISDWFRVENMIVDQCIGDLKNVQIFIRDPSEERVKEINYLLKNNDVNAKIFIHTSTNEKFSTNDIWLEAMNVSPDIKKNVERGLPPRRKTIDINYTNPNSRYKLISQGSDVQIERIIFIGDISIVRIFAPISKITKYYYEKDQDSIAETAHFELNGINLHKEIAIHKIYDQGETKFSVTATDLKDKGSNIGEEEHNNS